MERSLREDSRHVDRLDADHRLRPPDERHRSLVPDDPRYAVLPDPPAPGDRLIECGWHPVCGHVRHLAVGDRLELPLSPTLTYGLLPYREARARFDADCSTCAPPAVGQIVLDL